MTLTTDNPYRIPTADLAEFLQLPAAVRAAVEAWLDAMRAVARPIQRSLAVVAARLGVAAKTARRRYDQWRKSGDWRVFIDGRKTPAARGHRPEFIDWYRALCERNQRASAPAWREFERRWKAGEIIPGLDNARPRRALPHGCTYTNLQRLAPTPFELTTMRLGRGAAAVHRPKVLGTRAGLWVGSHLMFDDQWHDHFVIFGGQLVRVLEFDALDYFSGCNFAWGTQPRLRREDGVMTGLKEQQMRLLLASVLWGHGYSPRGTELIAEHGTAAIREEVERLLSDRSGGLITTRRSGMTGGEQGVAGMFAGDGKGNFRFKAPLESLRNLVHNELAALPGQTGKDRDHRPETLHGELRHASELVKAREVLPVKLAELLRLPLLDYHAQFLSVLDGCYRLINGREWHNLEGWSECGHIVVDYRVTATVDAWLSPDEFLRLPPAEQLAVAALARADAATYARTRKLSPQAVFNRGCGELVRLLPGVICELLGPDMAREEKVDAGAFRFADQELHPEPLTFEARVVDDQGRERELRDRETYLVFVNPFDLDQLFVADARGRSLGTARRDRRVARNDAAGVRRAWGRASQREEELLRPVRARHAALTRQRTKDATHNAQVLAAAGEDAADLRALADAALRGAE